MKTSKLKLTKAFKKGQNVAAIIVVGIIFLGQVFVVQISCKRSYIIILDLLRYPILALNPKKNEVTGDSLALTKLV